MSKQNILIIGSGIKEQLWAWKLRQSPNVGEIYATPANEPMRNFCSCSDIPLNDHSSLAKFAKNHNVAIALIPSFPSSTSSLVDELYAQNIQVFAFPRKVGEIGTSRMAFVEMTRHHGIPLPSCHVFENVDGALHFTQHASFPLVLKTDTPGKAKTAVCNSAREVEDYLTMSIKQPGNNGTERIMIENYVNGPVISVSAMVSSKNILTLPYGQILQNDHRIVGTYTTTSLLDPKIARNLERVILVPCIHVLYEYLKNYKGAITLEVVMGQKGPFLVGCNLYWDTITTALLLANLQSDAWEFLSNFLAGTLDKIESTWAKATIAFAVPSFTELKISPQDQSPTIEPTSSFIRIFQEKSKEATDRNGYQVCLVSNHDKLTEAGNQITTYWKERHLLPNAGLQEGLSKLGKTS